MRDPKHQALALVAAALAAGGGVAQAQQSPPVTATGPQEPLEPIGLVPYNVLGDSGETVTSGSSFNPMISVIFDGLFYRDDVDGMGTEFLSEADGFHLHGGEEGHSHGTEEEGFSIRETELTFSGTVDPYFDLWAIFAVSAEGIETEEVYAQTRKLLPGLQLKAGKFYSGIGFINQQHPHQWDFVDQALPYELIFGGALNEIGLQLNWLPKLPFYTRIGVEALQGENPGVASYFGHDEDHPWFDDAAGPRLFTGFVKVAPNVGYSHALQIGGFYGTGQTHQELHDEDEDTAVDEAFQGSTDFWGLDAVYKYDSPKDYGKGDLTIQGEYVSRRRNLDLVAEADVEIDPQPFRFEQDGFYLQAVYGFAPRWTAGLRYDRAGLTNEISGGGESLELDPTSRWSGDVTFNPTEFSRVRVQYNRSEVALGGQTESVNGYYVQLQISLGAHGAHRF